MSSNLIQGIAPDGTLRAIAVNEDGSIPVSSSPGGNASDASAANQLTEIERLIEIRDRLLLPSLYEQVLNSSDLVKTFTYADIDTADERIVGISIFSSSLGVDFSDGYIYEGAPGNYRLKSISRGGSAQ